MEKFPKRQSPADKAQQKFEWKPDFVSLVPYRKYSAILPADRYKICVESILSIWTQADMYLQFIISLVASYDCFFFPEGPQSDMFISGISSEEDKDIKTCSA